MSAGLFGLLDDVAAIAKLAAASVDDVGAAAGRATTKAAGVVVDDTAVTPQYVHGLAAERELPIVKKIAFGSIRNKLLIILRLALLLSQFLPDALPIILIIGGTYLAFEGAEKVWERVSHHDDHVGDLPTPSVEIGPDAEKRMIAGAVRTDLILSAEIMVIALDEVADEGFWARLAILVVVAFVITIAVYGVVALIVKMDDVGLLLTQRSSAFAQRVGRGAGRGDARAAGRDLPRRHRRDAVGRRPHHPGQRARGRPVGRAVRARPRPRARRRATRPALSAASSAGASTPRSRPSSAWWSARSWSWSCTCCPSARRPGFSE